MARLAPGTVGHAFARYYAENGILPFESPYEIRNDGDYLMKWYRETHDLHHVVTQYGTDAIGEMELQAFVAGNLGFRSCMFIVVMVKLFSTGEPLPPAWTYWRRMRAAYRRGQRTRNLFSVRYDHYFERQVSELRAGLGVP